MVFGPSGADRGALLHQLERARARRSTGSPTPGTPRGYARPRGATPLRVPLVPAFDACAAAEPQPRRAARVRLVRAARRRSSSQLTVGTPDANGKAGELDRLRAASSAIAGDPSTPADEADVPCS